MNNNGANIAAQLFHEQYQDQNISRKYVIEVVKKIHRLRM